MVLVHVRLDLEDEAGEVLTRGLHGLAGQRVGVRAGAGGQAQEVLEEGLDAEVRERGAEKHRGELARENRIEVELGIGTVEQLDVVHQVVVVVLADELGQRGVAERGLDLIDLLGAIGAAVTLERKDLAAGAVEYAAEVAAVADGPVHGIGADAEHVLDLFHEVKRVARLAVHLVHEREDRDTAHSADAEELLGLGLDALGAVDHHDRGVGGHEGAVRVLGEVLVAGGIENVHAAAAIGELEHRGGDGNTALLLDVHPVGDRMAGVLLALDRTGGLDGAGVEQELLGKGGLAGVGVRDDRERATRGDLRGVRGHGRVRPFLTWRRRCARRSMYRDLNRTYCSGTKHYIPAGLPRKRIMQGISTAELAAFRMRELTGRKTPCGSVRSNQPAAAKTRTAFSTAASRMNADFLTPSSFAASAMSAALLSGHLNERLAFGSSDKRGLPTRSSTKGPSQVPSSHSRAISSMSRSVKTFPSASLYVAIKSSFP